MLSGTVDVIASGTGKLEVCFICDTFLCHQRELVTRAPRRFFHFWVDVNQMFPLENSPVHLAAVEFIMETFDLSR